MARYLLMIGTSFFSLIKAENLSITFSKKDRDQENLISSLIIVFMRE